MDVGSYHAELKSTKTVTLTGDDEEERVSLDCTGHGDFLNPLSAPSSPSPHPKPRAFRSSPSKTPVKTDEMEFKTGTYLHPLHHARPQSRPFPPEPDA